MMIMMLFDVVGLLIMVCTCNMSDDMFECFKYKKVKQCENNKKRPQQQPQQKQVNELLSHLCPYTVSVFIPKYSII